ncbi:MAG: HEXXH motif-containing putative peptide modification protein [Flavobacteriaceae bacterium]
MRVLAPDENAKALDAAIRERLADSLQYVFERAGKPLGLDGERCDAAVKNVRLHRQMPQVFSSYYQLVFAIKQNRLEEAATLARELLAATGEEPEFKIEPYDRETLGEDFERFPRLLFAEDGENLRMGPIGPQLFAETKERLATALALLAEVDAKSHQEIHDLWVRLYVARGSDKPNALSFGGVTSFMVWGGGFMNADAFKPVWTAAQFLVHEITHALLFAISTSDPLVRNPLDKSYKSPLRPEPRPMDGIFHATVVCARMIDFNRMCIDQNRLDARSRDEMARQIPDLARRFHDGVDVVRREGMLSDRASLLIEQSCATVSKAA